MSKPEGIGIIIEEKQIKNLLFYYADRICPQCLQPLATGKEEKYVAIWTGSEWRVYHRKCYEDRNHELL